MLFRTRERLVLALFFCSGATGLVYEILWSKFLVQMFGSTIYAQTVVLATFMGGLAIGNRLFGRWAARLAHPVRGYGGLELAIGAYALFFPALDRWIDLVFVGLGASIADYTALLLALKALLSVTLLLVPTILMGGTLPLLAAWLQKYTLDAGRRTAKFYSTNSFGAVAGAALAGFWLVEHLGMVGAVRSTAVANLAIGILALATSRTAPPQPPAEKNKAPAQNPAVSAETVRWAGAIVALTGAVSMSLEVLASRSLVLVYGSSLQSFAVVLIAFILGIGLGSAWIASPRRTRLSNEKIIVVFLAVAGGWIALWMFNFEGAINLYRIARLGLPQTAVGYDYYQVLTTVLALGLLGVPAACIGAILPLMIRAISQQGMALGQQIGILLTWNTVGAVLGTLFAGFVLMPLLGLRNALATVALICALLALVAAWRAHWKPGASGAAVVAVLAGCLFFFGGEDWKSVMSSAPFRWHETQFSADEFIHRKQYVKILSYEDAADATVSVETNDAGLITLRINGKPDASVAGGGDLTTQFLLAHLPMLVRPDAKDVFVLGFGSGVTAGALLSYPVNHIVVAENCAPVIRAAKFFEPWNHQVLHDPRTHLWQEDARTVLKLSPQLYDVIITEPSNPWTVGVGSVFSREYYELAASRLKPGGIVSQWFHTYEMSAPILGLVLRTFNSVFPNMEVWDTGSGDIVLLGSLQPWPSGPDVFQQGFALDGVRSDLSLVGIHSPEALLARQLASQRTSFAIADNGPLQSDLFPILEYEAPRAFYIGDQTTILNLFDERTEQQLIAPAEKLAILRALPLDNVQAVFLDFPSVNDQLAYCLNNPGPGASLPCVFVPGSPSVALPAIPESIGSDAGDELHRAGALIEGSPAQRREAIDLIETVVRNDRTTSSWPAADWAALAASLALNIGDIQKAVEMASMAVQIDPDNLPAGYIARVVEREVTGTAGSTADQ
jgi:predicted membrane-bound spermidine synthase